MSLRTLSILAVSSTLAACATSNPRGAAAEAERAHAMRAKCPKDLVTDAETLEQKSVLAAGDWVPVADPRIFGPTPSRVPNDQTLTREATLKTGAVALVGRSGGDVLDVAVLRVIDEGACVVNSWASARPGMELAAVDQWVSANREFAVYLVELRETEAGKTATRWAVLATDGSSVWTPLGGDAGFQMLVKSARLRPQGKRLFLDVVVRGPGTSVFAFRDNGLFERVR